MSALMPGNGFRKALNIQLRRFYDDKGPELEQNVRFYFSTYGFPVEAQITEYVPPANNQPDRIAWHGWAGEDETR